MVDLGELAGSDKRLDQDLTRAYGRESIQRPVRILQVVKRAIAIDDVEAPQFAERYRSVEVKQANSAVRIKPQHLGDVERVSFGAEDITVAPLEEFRVQPDARSHLEHALSVEIEPERGKMLLARVVNQLRLGLKEYREAHRTRALGHGHCPPIQSNNRGIR